MPPDRTPPPLHRPVPRRPFSLNLTGATPPEDESPLQSPPTGASASSQFLDPNLSSSSGVYPESGSGSISRAQSIMNLTASTLFGIYSPTISGAGSGSNGRGHYVFGDRDETGTPWGTGAETPALRPDGDDEYEEGDEDEEGGRAAALEQLRERLGSSTRKISRARAASVANATYVASAMRPAPAPAPILPLAVRAILLFVLGVGYGAVVSRLRDEQSKGSFRGEPAGVRPVSFDRRSVVFWGVSGVVLGSLLPWFDLFWEQTLGIGRRRDAARQREPPSSGAADAGSAAAEEKAASKPDTDWALVIRGAGAFAGIVFAIRKLPWVSTMQVSVALALVNPFLWYLIDRSTSGFMLASAVGLVGSAVIMGLNPDMMPAPTSSGFGSGRFNSSMMARPEAFPRQATVETGIWMLSVLFCSCVCFGNIGRRLALGTSASARGRWGGVR